MDFVYFVWVCTDFVWILLNLHTSMLNVFFFMCKTMRCGGQGTLQGHSSKLVGKGGYASQIA